MTYTFAPAVLSQLSDIMATERAGFTPAEAATPRAMAARIAAYPETFIVAQDPDGAVAGYVVGPASATRYLTDDLYAHSEPNQPGEAYQTVLSLAVRPENRGQGLGSALLAHLATTARQQGRVAITLTCLQRLVPFYVRNGFVNEGVSASSHAGEVWFNMVRPLN
ncbi:GNAT family N-acetyltransferase [Lacticaseibacillus thailandensis]|uniref:Acetyltransferase, GNAT family n=1 Tax=Lacticaseibacillus thailandensis DSM 22698 = JCM 13996 TaxID=1423810 RepID=A0A0R2C8B4_9LACO|nr:GNAT family N-acetyltransferase [Lacticaseibacillus thailandensis]KRM87584.1 acetyltransferase, GNAT family [Lacticaseibacillus thailandensis DSM 22698 = JCM 13996]